MPRTKEYLVQSAMALEECPSCNTFLKYLNMFGEVESRIEFLYHVDKDNFDVYRCPLCGSIIKEVSYESESNS
jgi:uncharacterized protein with PIN domain